jgi:4-hydroxybenzoate polyprenyltransferase
MSEPLTVTVASGAASGVAMGSIVTALAAVFPEATPSVMICSLAGATFYVLTSQSYTLWKQTLLAMVSFIGGIYSAQMASDIISALINAALEHLNPPVTVNIPPAVGALVASAICVSVLIAILKRTRDGPHRKSGEDNP